MKFGIEIHPYRGHVLFVLKLQVVMEVCGVEMNQNKMGNGSQSGDRRQALNETKGLSNESVS